jgi:autotransporter passenger strand-loop-strand repeat protein
VQAAGSNTFNLSGPGAATLDYAAFQGFPRGTVFGGDWTMDGGAGSGWVVSKGALKVADGATFSNTIVKSGGTEVVRSGGTANGVNVAKGGTLELLGGNTVTAATLSAGSILAIGSGYLLNAPVSANIIVQVISGTVSSLSPEPRAAPLCFLAAGKWSNPAASQATPPSAAAAR